MDPVLIFPGDDPDSVADALIAAGYDAEFCLSPSFDPEFVASLMGSGFLVMSARFPGDSRAILLPKMHRERAIVEFRDLHESRSVRRILPRYELRFDEAFEAILEACVLTHGDEWLTDELTGAFRAIRAAWNASGADSGGRAARLASFALYRGGALVAGEFGAVAGAVYTSYSGFRREDSAGTAQLALTGRYLRDRGFAFWDLGMPLAYKDQLGARPVAMADFLTRFRDGRSRFPLPQ
jgi:leucyl/phenylalanyl-tRNA--protein transferase